MESFTKSGAIFGTCDRVHIGGGAYWDSSTRPSGPAFYAPDFFMKEPQPWRRFESHATLSPGELCEELGPKERGPLFAESWQEPQWNDFQNQYQRVQEGIRHGQIRKAVPCVFAENRASRTSSEIVRRLLQTVGPSFPGYLYGLWDENQMIFGITPEILVEQKSECQWQTMALAGTVSKAEYQSHPESFLNDCKENREHQWVVDDICEQWQGLGELEIHSREVIEAGSIVHLRTVMDLQATNVMPLNTMIAKLHPTPALGVYPRSQWPQWMQQVGHPESRQRFGAPFAFSENPSRATVVVAIRNIQGKDGHFQLGSGCGVVEESQLEKEWNELANKRASVRELLQL